VTGVNGAKPMLCMTDAVALCTAVSCFCSMLVDNVVAAYYRAGRRAACEVVCISSSPVASALGIFLWHV
jgi:hypothetical protein